MPGCTVGSAVRIVLDVNNPERSMYGFLDLLLDLMDEGCWGSVEKIFDAIQDRGTTTLTIICGPMQIRLAKKDSKIIIDSRRFG